MLGVEHLRHAVEKFVKYSIMSGQSNLTSYFKRVFLKKKKKKATGTLFDVYSLIFKKI